MSLRARALLAACFLVSGATGLVYEVVWSRYLASLFGSTTEAVSVVLAVFLLGLGLGAHVFGGRVDRSASPARLYALLETGIGLLALATGPLLFLVRALYAAAARGLEMPFAAGLALKALLAAAVLLPPALLMGGTLPALVRAVARSADDARAGLGLFYALNTLGAVAGTYATGFYLLPAIGLSNTMQLAAALNLAIGLVVYVGARWWHAVPPVAPDRATWAALRELLATRRAVAFGLFVSGATTMIYEVVFARVLGLVFGVSSYAFALVLAIFLLGLALGAFVYRAVWRGRASGFPQFAATQLLAAAAVVGALAAVPLVPRLVLYARQIPQVEMESVLAWKGLLAAAVLLPLSVLLGLGLPLLVGALAGDVDSAGRRIGAAYLVNTLGTVSGSLVAGFALVPALGTERALRAAVLLNLVAGVSGVLGARLRSSRAAFAGGGLAVLLLLLAAPHWRWTVFSSPESHRREPFTSRLDLESHLAGSPNELLFLREGRSGTVAVTQSSNVRTLLVGGHPDASDTEDMSTQLLLPLVPLSAHAEPKDVLLVGFGSGVSADAAVRYPTVSRVDCVEMESAVLAASPYFHHVNHAVERSPKLRVVVDDARGYMETTDRRYDVIVSEPSNPWRAGVANVFTRDFYLACRARLTPGGVMAQWAQLYALDFEALLLIVSTFRSVFPEVQVFSLAPRDIVLVGSDRPIAIDVPRATSRLRASGLVDALRRHARIDEPEEVFARQMVGAGEVSSLVDGVSVHTLDLPLLEFAAPRGLYAPDAQNELRLLAVKRASGSAVPIANGSLSDEDLALGMAEMLRPARLTTARSVLEENLDRGGRRIRLRAAEYALEAGDLASARRHLDAVSGDDERSTLLLARLLAREKRREEAIATYERLPGEHAGQVERLGLLVDERRGAEALDLAGRLLAAARLGGTIGAPEVRQVYEDLLRLEAQGAALGRSLALVESLPAADAGFPENARLHALAALYERAGQPGHALAACERARANGYLAPAVLAVEERCLRGLGRTDEARRVRERLLFLAPEYALRPSTPRPR